MKLKNHLITAITVFITWGAFYLVGIPSHYFSDLSLTEYIIITCIAVYSVFPLTCAMLVIFFDGDYVKSSLWVALYASALPFLLDYLIVGIIGHAGIYFLVSHWWLTAGYIGAWISIPLTGIAMKKFSERIAVRS